MFYLLSSHVYMYCSYVHGNNNIWTELHKETIPCLARNQVMSQLRLIITSYRLDLREWQKSSLILSLKLKLSILIESFETFIISSFRIICMLDPTVCSVSPKLQAGDLKWLCLKNNTNPWLENSWGTYGHYYFVRATLILHGWSWLSTIFMYRPFCQDLSSQTSHLIFSLRTSMK